MKPGTEVRHRPTGQRGTVTRLSPSGRLAIVRIRTRQEPIMRPCPIDTLEVVQ